MNELYHHGVLGQKWGVRRYQNKDGSLTAAGRQRYSKNLKFETGDQFFRYSNKVEKGSLSNTYMMNAPSDIKNYYLDAKNVRLGFKTYDKLYMTKISALDKGTIKRGKDVIDDLMPIIGDKSIDVAKEYRQYVNNKDKISGKEAYEYLKKIGYLDDTKSVNERYDIYERNNMKNAANVNRKILGRLIHDEVYKQRGQYFVEKYKNTKYDAIVDPEDFVWNYQQPMIIINPDKFERTKTEVIYNKSLKDFDKEVPKEKQNDISYKEVEKLQKYTGKKLH